MRWNSQLEDTSMSLRNSLFWFGVGFVFSVCPGADRVLLNRSQKAARARRRVTICFVIEFPVNRSAGGTVSMTKYHAMGKALLLEDGPAETQTIAEAYRGRAIPEVLTRLRYNSVRCPQVNRFVYQEDDSRRLLVRLSGTNSENLSTQETPEQRSSLAIWLQRATTGARRSSWPEI
jgi:hypothetical protein